MLYWLSETTVGAFSLMLLLLSVPAVFIFLARLLKGARRHPPIQPLAPTPSMLGTVSIIVPTLNEAHRISPCLTGLSQQGYEVREIAIVDSQSQDGTRERVKDIAATDPRFRLLTDDPLPPDWVGRPWALNYGFLHTSPQSEWVLGIDADTQPKPGLVAGLLAVAEAEGYDVLSLSPQFILKSPGEWWLQPALLMTLLYRFEASGAKPQTPDRVMANGQCFLSRRSVLQQLGGYDRAKGSFCDDVTLARYAATQGFKVGFLDGKRVFQVRMYEGMRETWREWGRSLDLKDASSVAQLWGDLWVLLFTQGLPIPLSLVGLGLLAMGGYSSLPLLIVTGLNLGLVGIRIALLWAIAPSYCSPKSTLTLFPLPLSFYLSPLADPLAVLRIFLSATQKPTQWRGRQYG